MIIISEVTGKEYKTVDECLAAEKDFLKKKLAEEKAEREKQEALDEAFEEAVEACGRYLELAERYFEEEDDDDYEEIEELVEFLDLAELIESIFK